MSGLADPISSTDLVKDHLGPLERVCSGEGPRGGRAANVVISLVCFPRGQRWWNVFVLQLGHTCYQKDMGN